MAYKIFTDATADLNEELLRGLPQVEVIPMEIMVDGQIYKYGLHEKLETKQFYEELRNGKFASTAQINPAVYQEYFSLALAKGYDVLYLCFSSGMSGTFYTAEYSKVDLEELPEAEVKIADIGAVIGSHTGPGLLALIYWGNNR